jgi:hypothetical protein
LIEWRNVEERKRASESLRKLFKTWFPPLLDGLTLLGRKLECAGPTDFAANYLPFIDSPTKGGENILSSAITERGKKKEKEGVCNICY